MDKKDWINGGADGWERVDGSVCGWMNEKKGKLDFECMAGGWMGRWVEE